MSAATTPDLSVDLAPDNPRELRLRNPVIAASGCFGYGEEYASVIDIDRLGAFVSKGITPERRAGNPMPRIVESPAGMLNAIGLQNPGIHGFVKKYPPMWARWTVPAIVNISAESVNDYAMMAAILDEQPAIAAIEVNVSCPNIARGGYCFRLGPTDVGRRDTGRAIGNDAADYRQTQPRGIGYRRCRRRCRRGRGGRDLVDQYPGWDGN